MEFSMKSNNLEPIQNTVFDEKSCFLEDFGKEEKLSKLLEAVFLRNGLRI